MPVKSHGPGFEEIKKSIDDLENLNLQVGWFESAKYADKNETPVAYVASINEFGYPEKNIPPRPFLRPTVSDNRDEWAKELGLIAGRILNGKMTSEEGLNAFGLRVSGQIRKTISQIWEPELSQKTIKARLRQRRDKKTIGQLNKPLVFEGILLNSLTYIVNGGEERRAADGGGP